MAKFTAKEEVTPKTAREVQLEKDLVALKETAEKDAVAKVCASLGIDPATLDEKKNEAEPDGPLMHYDIGTSEVHINGYRFTGKGQAGAKVVEMILAMAGAQRMRKLNEKIGNDYEVMQLADGTLRSRHLGQSPESII